MRVLFPYSAADRVFVVRAEVWAGRRGTLTDPPEHPEAEVRDVRTQDNRAVSVDALAALAGVGAEELEAELCEVAMAVAADIAIERGECL